MNAARNRCRSILGELAASDGVHGACLVSRGGLPALWQWQSPADLETIAAMGAALAGAAETSLLEFGQQRLATVLVVAQDLRLVIIGVDDELLLLAAVDRDVPIDRFDQQLMESLTSLNLALQEAS